MSEISDAVAVVEMMGRFFVFTGKFAVGAGKLAVEIGAATYAWEKNKPLRKGEQRFSKLVKKSDGDFTVLKFGEITEEAFTQICERFLAYKIAYAEAPFFGKKEQKAIAVQNKDINLVKTLLEGIEYDWLGAASYLKQQDPEVVTQAANGAKTYEEQRGAYETMKGSVSEQLNHKEDWTKAHEEPWYLIDLDNPKNYIQMTAQRIKADDKWVVRTTYITYRDGEQMSVYEDRHGFTKWEKAKESMMEDIGVTDDYKNLVTIRGKEAGGYLKKYQDLFEAEKAGELKEEQSAPDIRPEAKSIQFIPAPLVRKSDEKALFCVIETADAYVKIPASFVMESNIEGKVKVKMPEELIICDKSGNEIIRDGKKQKIGADKVMEDVLSLAETLSLKAAKNDKKR